MHCRLLENHTLLLPRLAAPGRILPSRRLPRCRARLARLDSAHDAPERTLDIVPRPRRSLQKLAPEALGETRALLRRHLAPAREVALVADDDNGDGGRARDGGAGGGKGGPRGGRGVGGAIRRGSVLLDAVYAPEDGLDAGKGVVRGDRVDDDEALAVSEGWETGVQGNSSM